MKTKIVDMDLFQTIEDISTTIYEIKALLKQLNSSDSPNSIISYEQLPVNNMLST